MKCGNSGGKGENAGGEGGGHRGAILGKASERESFYSSLHHLCYCRPPTPTPRSSTTPLSITVITITTTTIATTVNNNVTIFSITISVSIRYTPRGFLDTLHGSGLYVYLILVILSTKTIQNKTFLRYEKKNDTKYF